MRIAPALLLIATLALSACSTEGAVLIAAGMPKLLKSPEEVNLIDMNYGAADMLVSSAGDFLNKDTTIAVFPLENTNKTIPEGMEKVPPATFGKVVAKQVEARLVQLGYNVKGRGGRTSAEANLSGYYSVVGNDVLVNLRLIRNDGRILSAYNYHIPRWSRDIKGLLGYEGKGNAFLEKLEDYNFTDTPIWKKLQTRPKLPDIGTSPSIKLPTSLGKSK